MHAFLHFAAVDWVLLAIFFACWVGGFSEPSTGSPALAVLNDKH